MSDARAPCPASNLRWRAIAAADAFGNIVTCWGARNRRTLDPGFQSSAITLYANILRGCGRPIKAQ